MLAKMRRRVRDLQNVLRQKEIDVAIIMDADSIFYYTGVHDYIEMELGRPLLLFVPDEGEPTLTCPDLEMNMAQEMTWIKRVVPWFDGVGNEWRASVREALTGRAKNVGIERMKTHTQLLSYIDDQHPDARLMDIGHETTRQRAIKDRDEIETMRKAGAVAVAMCSTARDVIAPGVTEYEIALAIAEAGSRTCAELLRQEAAPLSKLFSPLISGRQVLQSGPYMHMVHKRAGTRRIEHGDSVYMCFCNNAEYRYMKVGFDRQYFVGVCTKEAAVAYEQALLAQKAALSAIRPGVRASEVHRAAAEYYESLKCRPCYRTGRAVGYARLEKPELSANDDTLLVEGMTFAVDGAVLLSDDVVGRVGDTVVVTDKGFEYITQMDNALTIL